MADEKITELDELAAAPATGDELEILDVSDTSMAAGGTNKRITAANLVPKDAAAGTPSLRSLSTTSTTAAAGNDSRFPAGADIVDADVSATAAIAETKVANLVNDLALPINGGIPATGITYQSYPRNMGQQVATLGPTSTGTLKLTAVWLPLGFTVTSVSFLSGGTALTTSGSGPHFWMGLFDSARVVLRQSTDVTNATWATNALKTVNLSSTFVTTYTGLHYLGLLVCQGSTGTPPQLTGASQTTAAASGLAPILAGNSTTSLGATATGTAETAITATTIIPYCGVA